MEEDLFDPLWYSTVDGVVHVALGADEPLKEGHERREEAAAPKRAQGGFQENPLRTIGGGWRVAAGGIKVKVLQD